MQENTININIRLGEIFIPIFDKKYETNDPLYENVVEILTLFLNISSSSVNGQALNNIL